MEKNEYFVGKNPVQLISRDCQKYIWQKFYLDSISVQNLFHFKVMRLNLDKQYNF